MIIEPVEAILQDVLKLKLICMFTVIVTSTFMFLFTFSMLTGFNAPPCLCKYGRLDCVRQKDKQSAYAPIKWHLRRQEGFALP